MITTRLILVSLSLAIPGTLFAQGKDAAKPDAATEKTVIQMEHDCSAALTKHDAAALAAMLADNFYLVTPDGTAQTKAEFVADVKSGELKLESNQLSDIKVHQADSDMAVVTYRSSDKGTYKGKDISGECRWTDVLVKRDGRWQFVLGQGTSIAPKAAQ